MSDSPKPSASAGISIPVAYSEALLPSFPSRMFFDAKDYTPGVDRRKVAEARTRSVAELQRKKDQLGIAIAGLRTSDDYGLVRNALEVLEEVAVALHKDVTALARLGRNAEARYDEAHPVVAAGNEPEAGTAGAALTSEIQRLIDSPLVASTANIRPGTPRHHPESMVEAMQIRNAKLREMNQA